MIVAIIREKHFAGLKNISSDSDFAPNQGTDGCRGTEGVTATAACIANMRLMDRCRV